MNAASLRCNLCGSANPQGMRFCGSCGAQLAPVCPSCGQTAPREMRFCGYCGAPLSGEASATAVVVAPQLGATVPVTETRDRESSPHSPDPFPAERRLVTTLFCDLVGFTPLAEQLDPEDVREIQAAYFGAMVEQITRYGGVVEKYAGDAVLALFGVPVAHEDDAERAVLCALSLHDAIEPVVEGVRSRWQLEPAIRVGVNTGEVVSGSWDIAQGVSGRQDVAVTGDTVNTAARLQAAAEPGSVMVGTETMRLTRRRIRYGEARLLTLKGKAEHVPAYVALGVSEQIGERWEMTRSATPLIGREQELGALQAAWERARQGEGQLISVVGEPGVGKSRLLSEAVERTQSEQAARLLRGRCLSYGQSISLWLIADLLRGLFNIGERDRREQIRSRVDDVLDTLLDGAEGDDRREARDVLGEVLGLPPGGSMVSQAGPQIRRQTLIRSIRHVLRAIAVEQPVLLLLEDVHWIDGASEEVLGSVLVDVPGLPVLVLAAQRPGWTAPWSEWGWTERLSLHPLDETDAARLAEAVLGRGRERISAELEHYVAERAGGNPFFVEELLTALRERAGLIEQDGELRLAPEVSETLPATLTELLLARLDRLEAQVKQVAQVGSVIGRSFAVRLLARVMDQHQVALELPLTRLQRAELAFPARTTELEYVFKHVLVRDVAYGMLVRKRRQALHLQVARAIAQLYPAEEYVELIAHHYARTEEQAEAIEWLERAGDRASAIYATAGAQTHYQETIRRLQSLGGDALAVARVEEKLGAVLYAAGRYDEALEALSRAAELYREQRELEAAGRVIARMGMAHRFRGTPEEGIKLVGPMIEELGDEASPGLAALTIALAGLNVMTGRYHEAETAAERAGEIARELGDERLMGEAEERRAMALDVLGRSEEALRIYEVAIPLIEGGGDLLVLQRGLSNAGAAALALGQIEGGRGYLERALALAERTGNPDQTAFRLASVGLVLTFLGDWGEAQAHLERAMMLLGTERASNAAAVGKSLGELTLNQGRWEEAERLLTEALAVSQRTGNLQALQGVQGLLAELDVRAGRPRDAIDRLVDLAAAEEVDFVVPIVLACAYLEVGEARRAEECVSGVIVRTRAGGQRFYLPEALRAQGMVFVSLDRWEEAEAVFHEGLEVARSMPHRYVEARILHQLGLLARQRGRPAQAQQQLEAALAIFRRLGAQKDVEAVEQTLAALTGPAH